MFEKWSSTQIIVFFSVVLACVGLVRLLIFVNHYYSLYVDAALVVVILFVIFLFFDSLNKKREK